MSAEDDIAAMARSPLLTALWTDGPGGGILEFGHGLSLRIMRVESARAATWLANDAQHRPRPVGRARWGDA